MSAAETTAPSAIRGIVLLVIAMLIFATMDGVQKFLVADYTIAQVYFNNTDWPFSNIKYWRPQQAGGKWRWILFDTDGGFGGKEWVKDEDAPYNLINRPNHDTLDWLLDEDGATDTATLFAWLWANTNFKSAWLDRFDALMKTSRVGNFAASTVQAASVAR